MPPDGNELLMQAIPFAARAHMDQTRKDGVTPYIAHPVRVMTLLVTEFGVKEPQVLAAAVLHDTMEDTRTDRDALIEHFGERVAEYVSCLTKDKRLREDEREQVYLETLVNAPFEVKLCKLADVLDNLRDLPEIDADARWKFEARAIRKAKRLIEQFTPEFPKEWDHVLNSVQRQIDILEQQSGKAG
jgi:guanosine-3',5'-bis(diphosphate) 3'-pyrophosphohydrolase